MYGETLSHLSLYLFRYSGDLSGCFVNVNVSVGLTRHNREVGVYVFACEYMCTLVCAWRFVDTLLKPESEICGLSMEKESLFW